MCGPAEPGLSWTVSAEALNDAEVEIHVEPPAECKWRRPHDLVSIADVGFGVSQVLPVVVALHAAKEGQAVYIEQPEIHLHPRAGRSGRSSGKRRETGWPDNRGNA